MVLVHGFGEHSGRYDPLGAWFAERGSAVHAFDQHGHGESAGDEQGHLESFSDFLDDLEEFIAARRAEAPGLPCTLVGHSMGGLVATASVCERPGNVDFLVTSGALLGLAPGMSRFKVAAARALRKLLPRLRMGAGVDPEALSRDPEVGRRYVADPLVFTKMTASLGDELLRGILRTAGAGQGVSIPVLMLHGADDQLCPPVGTERFWASLPDPERHGSELRVIPGLRHEIFNEPDYEELFAEVDEWLRARECASKEEAQ